MTLQTDVTTAVADLQAARTTVQADTAILHAIVNGPATGSSSLITTGSGTVKSAARAISELADGSGYMLRDFSNATGIVPGSNSSFGFSVGDVKLSVASSPATGFLRLTDDVQNPLKADYPDLHAWVAAQGYPWGSTSTTFGIPRAGGYFLRFGASGSSIDADGPRTPGTPQAQSLKSHTHSNTVSTDGAHTHTLNYQQTAANSGAGSSMPISGGTSVSTNSSGAHTHTVTINSTGDGPENRPINVTMYADMLAVPSLVASGLVGTTGYALQYTNGTSGNPGTGYFGFDNTTLASASTLRVSKTGANGAALGPALALLAYGVRLMFTKVGAPSTYVQMMITGTPTDGTTHYSVTFAALSSNGTFTYGDSYSLLVSGVRGANYGGTSTTSTAIPDVSGGAVSKTLTVETGLAYQAGALVRLNSTSSGEATTHWMMGVVTAYNPTTGSITVSVTDSRGSGSTRAAWNLNIAGVSGDVTPEASALASAAAASASAASSSASAASSSATTASTAASSATSSASAASTSATNAASSATAAATSATNAASSATSAASSATTATSQATAAASSATAAASSETAAASSATAAAASASAAAVYAAALSGTSTSSVALGTGTLTFTTQANKQFAVAQWIELAKDTSNYAVGICTAYNSSTGVMSIDVANASQVVGSGTYTAWTVNITGKPGPQGPAGSLNVSSLSQVTPASNDKIVIGDTSNADATAYVLPSDLPISTATQTALDGKADVASAFTADNRLVRTDRPTSNNRSVQASGITINDSDDISGVHDLTVTGNVTLAADASAAMHPVTKQQFDNGLAGLRPKAQVLCATTANITLSGEQTIDGVTTSESRVLVKDHATAALKGIYVSSSGAWTRATDMNTWTEVPSAVVLVEQGTVNGDTGWVCTADTGGTLDTTAITWSKFYGSGTFQPYGALLTAIDALSMVADRLIYGTGSNTVALTTLTSFMRTLLDDANQAAAQTTLGIGTAGLKATGTSGNTVPLLDGANTWSGKQTFSKATAHTPVALTDGATVAVDASLSDIFTLSAAGDRTILAPSNATDGQKMTLRVLASGGARTITLTTGSTGAFRYGSDITGLTATASGKIDYIGAIYNATDSRWDVVAVSKGY